MSTGGDAMPEQQPQQQRESDPVLTRLDQLLASNSQVLANHSLLLTTVTELGQRVTDIDTHQQETAAVAARAIAMAQSCMATTESQATQAVQPQAQAFST